MEENKYIGNVRAKVAANKTQDLPEYKSRDEFYAYAAKNMITLNVDEAYKDCSDSLLPIFKAAKELCEDLHEGENKNEDKKDSSYFKRGRPLKELYHMAIVSKVIQEINENCITEDDKKHSIKRARFDDDRNYFFRNGERINAGWLLHREKIENFMEVMDAPGMSYDDEYTKAYIAALKDDVSPVYGTIKRPKCSVTGNILNWEDMKDSSVLRVVAAFDQRSISLNEDTIAKINAFCDKKNKENQQQIQKSMKEKASLSK